MSAIAYIEIRYRLSGNGGAWEYVRVAPNASSLSLKKGVVAGQQYIVEARSVTTTGMSSVWASQVYTLNGAAIVLITPDQPRILGVADGVDISWTITEAIPSGVEFEVERAPNSNATSATGTTPGAYAPIGRTKGTSHHDAVTDGRVYWYRVRAVNYRGGVSAWVSATTNTGIGWVKAKAVADGADVSTEVTATPISNPKFEAGDTKWIKPSTTGWTIIKDDNAMSGEWVARKSGGPALDVLVNSAVTPVAMGQAVTIRGYLRATSGNGYARMGIRWLNSTGGVISSSYGNKVFPGSGYEPSYGSMVAPANALFCQIFLEVGDYSTGSWYVDNTNAFLNFAAEEDKALLTNVAQGGNWPNDLTETAGQDLSWGSGTFVTPAGTSYISPSGVMTRTPFNTSDLNGSECYIMFVGSSSGRFSGLPSIAYKYFVAVQFRSGGWYYSNGVNFPFDQPFTSNVNDCIVAKVRCESGIAKITTRFASKNNFQKGTDTVGNADVREKSLSTSRFLVPPAENLIPNGYCEAGQSALGTLPEGAYLSNDPTNSKEGNWCRRVPVSGLTGSIIDVPLTDYIETVPGQQYFFAGWSKSSSGMNYTNYFVVSFYDKDKALLTEPSVAVTSGTGYAERTLKPTAPGSAVFVRVSFRATNQSSNAGLYVWLDAMQLRKMVTFDLLAANTLQTTNYYEDGFGNPMAGAKLDHQGTSLKVASSNLQVGSFIMTDPWFRVIQALGGPGASNRVFYRGNNDPGIRGGAPNLAQIRIQSTAQFLSSAPSMSVCTWRLNVVPVQLNDNLDGLRHAHIVLYLGNGATSQYIAQYDYFLPLNDRTYFEPEGFGWNVTNHTFQYTYLGLQVRSAFAGGSAQFWDMRVNVMNVYGVSDTKWFLCTSGHYVDFPQGNAGRFGGVPGGSTGGGSGDPGICLAPWEPILLSNGEEIAAGDVRKGMKVYTMHETTGEKGAHTVTYSGLHENDRSRLLLTDGRVITAAKNHLFLVAHGGWSKMEDLRAGDSLAGLTPGTVLRVAPLDRGPVMKITVPGAHTYMNKGILSHNLKPRT